MSIIMLKKGLHEANNVGQTIGACDNSSGTKGCALVLVCRRRTRVHFNEVLKWFSRVQMSLVGRTHTSALPACSPYICIAQPSSTKLSLRHKELTNIKRHCYLDLFSVISRRRRRRRFALCILQNIKNNWIYCAKKRI